MYVQRHEVTITTDSDGDGTDYTPVIHGRILAISYVKTDFANGVDFTITTETTLQNVWVDTNVDASEIVYPMAIGSDQVGAAITDPKYVPIPAAQERVKIVIASGGDEKSGTFHVLVG